MKQEIKREKMVVTIGGAFALILAYFIFFALPVSDSIKAERAKQKAELENTVKLKEILEEYSGQEKPEDNKLEGSLSAFVETTANNLNIKIAFMRPYGKGGEGVEIKIDEMTGKELVNFAYLAEEQGIVISRLNARDYKGQGIWVVRMNLEKI